MVLPVSMRTGTLTQRMRSGYLIIARMLSSSPSAFAARSKFSSATSYAFIGFVAVANMANLQSSRMVAPNQAPRQGGACGIRLRLVHPSAARTSPSPSVPVAAPHGWGMLQLAKRAPNRPASELGSDAQGGALCHPDAQGGALCPLHFQHNPPHRQPRSPL